MSVARTGVLVCGWTRGLVACGQILVVELTGPAGPCERPRVCRQSRTVVGDGDKVNHILLRILKLLREYIFNSSLHQKKNL